VFYKVQGYNRKRPLSSYFVRVIPKRVPLSCNTEGSVLELIKPNVSNHQTYFIMTKNGKKILEFLEKFQYEVAVGCDEGGHKYGRNGTISCIKCGMVKY